MEKYVREFVCCLFSRLTLAFWHFTLTVSLPLFF